MITCNYNNVKVKKIYTKVIRNVIAYNTLTSYILNKLIKEIKLTEQLSKS